MEAPMRTCTCVVFIAIALTLTLGACGSSQASAPLDDQVKGWWVTPQTGDCYCPPQPECGAGDCVSYSVLGLLPDGSYYDGRVSVSSKGKTMSTMGALSTGKYRVQGSTVIISQSNIPDATLETKVTNAQLTLGSRVDDRAPVNLSTALDRSTVNRASAWSAQSYGE
jgi:hypothetical protein